MVNELSIEQLRRRVNVASLGFETTESIEPSRAFLGQERALEAIATAMEIDARGYHLFVANSNGVTGPEIRDLIVDRIAEHGDRRLGTLVDQVYVENHDDKKHPKVLQFSSGQGAQFRGDLKAVVDRTSDQIERYVHHYAGTNIPEDEDKEKEDAVQKTLQDLIKKDPRLQHPQIIGLMLNPSLTNDNVYESIKGENPFDRELFDEFRSAVLKQKEIDEETDKRGQIVKKEVATLISESFAELKDKYSSVPGTGNFLKGIEGDLTQTFKFMEIRANNSQVMQQQEEEEDDDNGEMALTVARANFGVVVVGETSGGVPVVYEPNPTFERMFGRVVSHVREGGAIYSDHTDIVPGSVHEANGGYLIIDGFSLFGKHHDVAQKLLTSIKANKVDFKDPIVSRFSSGSSLEPESCPLDLKLVLVGEGWIDRAVRTDPDYRDLVGMKAQFAPTTRIEVGESFGEYVGMISGIIDEHDLRHFSNDGVAAVIEQGLRLGDSQKHVTLAKRELRDVMLEADVEAKKQGADYVGAEHVHVALERKRFRASLFEEMVQDGINDGMKIIDVTGEKVGQVNGLYVYDTGDHMFGGPGRLTAVTGKGKGIIHIERESKNSGKIHDKGFLTLRGYLLHQFGQKKDLSLSASLTFEQSYGGIDGDSATFAEFAALMSSLSDVPIRQYLAATGSMDQRGRIQPIGGVNEKTEGFFTTCQRAGLTGEQGVIIPYQNVDNLMLRQEVVDAVGDGQFHVYPIRTAEEGIEQITGVPAKNVYAAVEKKLAAFAKKPRAAKKK